MRRIAASLLLLICIAALFAGCSGEQAPSGKPASTKAPLPEGLEIELKSFPPDFFKTPIATMAPKDKPLLFSESFVSGGGSEEMTVWKVYEDYDSFRERFPQVPECLARITEDDFKTMILVEVTDTVRTGGYTFKLTSACYRGGAICIDCEKDPPPHGSMVTMAFQSNTVIVGLSRSGYSSGMGCVVTVNGRRVNEQASE